MNKPMALVGLAAATTLLLAGCTSGGGAPAAESAAPSEEAAGAGAELVIWTDAEREEAIATAAAAFEEETGATVTLVQKNFEDLRNDFVAQVPTGEGPDITVGAHDWLGALVAAGVVSTLDLGDAAGDFEPVALEAMTYDGQLYALPYSLETIALVQNVDMVGEDAPATWDELVQRAEEAGAERPIAINTAGETGDGYTMYGFQTSFGAPVFVQDESGSYTTEVGMGGEAGEAFAQWLHENGTAGSGIISTTVDYDINNELFNSGQAPFTVQGPWAMSAFTDVPNIAVHPIPSAGGEPAAPFVGVQGFYVSSQSENALLAQEFLVNHLATEEAQRALYEADPRIPAFTSLAEEVASDPIIAGFLASSQNGVPMPSIPEMGSVWDLWNAAEVQIINGADPVETWNQMVSDLEAELG
ncbi:extracellular solute-binding protein [Microbacterium sp.]|uniref:sugar ABC transporter substrate-binding protein n=1 Tax=Microbacterium sp. TaxID=51671 RepID=UPI002810B06D|nr:extracellular solute-binding protein [Microbacterium sp.]